MLKFWFFREKLPIFQQELPKIDDCYLGTFVEEYLLISSVYALIDYVIIIFFLWLLADHTLGHKALWLLADHTVDHIWFKVWSAWNHKPLWSKV